MRRPPPSLSAEAALDVRYWARVLVRELGALAVVTRRRRSQLESGLAKTSAPSPLRLEGGPHTPAPFLAKELPFFRSA